MDPELVRGLHDAFASGRTRGLEWRHAQLAGLGRLLAEREGDILGALRSDLGKPVAEAYTSDIGPTSKELALAARNVGRWVRPERVRTPLVMRPGTAYVAKEPVGVALIIAPWNYPLQLSLVPLIGALAAGNCVLLKPSELSPATSQLLARALPEYVDPAAVRVVEGGVRETTAVLEQRFDHIFFTGSATVGRVVMEAAAKHLTPVTLELGGKCPCIVDEQVDLEVAARRIVWGKFFNAGQTCVAPDYVLVHERLEAAFVEQLRTTLREFYGDDPRSSPDYGRIVNARHVARLARLLESGTIACGGQFDEASRYFAPTILRDVPAGSPAMAEEIFGPILPVLSVGSIEHAIRFVNGRPRPLALYVFTKNRNTARRVLESTSSGGAGVNQVCLQVAVSDLPFGGVGPSGMGAYHGRTTFDAFTHRKSVYDRPTYVDPKLAYPPIDERSARWMRRLL
jgi:aldehyde dehydrogenase (NAD+)